MAEAIHVGNIAKSSPRRVSSSDHFFGFLSWYADPRGTIGRAVSVAPLFLQQLADKVIE
jgi:hypothetical protein